MTARTDDIHSFYFDESGFTGPNLLDSDQPWFVYVGVSLNEDKAHNICVEAHTRFGLQGSELKGAALIRSNRGREALSWILGEVSPHARGVVADKRYALAGKFFDYMIEPIIAGRNGLFYAIDFHKFIATHLFMFSLTDRRHDALLRAFSDMARSMEIAELDKVYSIWRQLNGLSPVGMMYTFSARHRERVEDELLTARNAGAMAKWQLELTGTALYSLLCHWSDTPGGLEVYCDRSKPLAAMTDFFDGFIGRHDKGYVRLSSAPPSPILFNLKKPIFLVDSRNSFGIQLADVLASTLAFILKRPDVPESRRWRNICGSMIVNYIVPDKTLLDLAKRETFVNTWVLCEFSDESNDLIEILAKIPNSVRLATLLHPHYLHDR